jgi:hypothetical protein
MTEITVPYCIYPVEQKKKVWAIQLKQGILLEETVQP